MPQPVVVPNILPVNVDVSTLSIFEIMKGDRKTGKVVSIMANDELIKSV